MASALKAKGPASAATDPDHDPNNPQRRDAVSEQQHTSAPAVPATIDFQAAFEALQDDLLVLERRLTVRALRPFDNGDELKDENSKPFKVSRQRFAELKANGLVEAAEGEIAEHDGTDVGLGTRVAAARESAEREIAAHEARAREAGEAANKEIEGHSERVVQARANADAAVREQEDRVAKATDAAEAAEKQRQTADNKQASDPANKAAPKMPNKAA